MGLNHEKLTAGNVAELSRHLTFFRQVLPFYPSHTEARETFLERLSRYDVQGVSHMSLVVQDQLIAVISCLQVDKVLTVTDFLLSPVGFQQKRGLSFWLTELEKYGKYLNVKKIVFTCGLVDITLSERLVGLGYEVTLEHGKALVASKELSYRTALVLAGGGARGAYQIGIWRALRELNSQYEVITGTSVGALNGSLMLQDDFQVAEDMWEEIDTGKILSYPHVGEADQRDSRQVLKEAQQFAQSALLNQGVSTAPLAAMIHKLLDGDKMRRAPQELYICTTEFPSLKEVVISVDKTEPEQFSRWLLASSSFFPAMAATKIDNHYYVDGGYRNNIPIDVALKAGATELIILDVKGPGVTKATKIPRGVPVRYLTSPWDLGTVLFFDGSRSQWNIALGYLEALKSFGHYRGYWYTYSGDFNQLTFQQSITLLLQEFKAVLSPSELGILFKPELIASLKRKISPLYQERLTEEGLFLYVLEFVAKDLAIDPTICYDVPRLLVVIKEQLAARRLSLQTVAEKEASLTAWLKERLAGVTLSLETQQLHYLIASLRESNLEQPQLLALARVSPFTYLVAKLVLYLEQ